MSHEPATAAPVEVHGTASATSTSGRFSLPVSWADLTYKVPGHEVLRGLTGTALPSRSLAIIGSSGAGKTTMLNAISARVQEDATHVVGGRRQLGDIEFERKYRKVVGYVTQDDIIGALATPASALAFSLRIRRGTSREETEQRVNDVLRELHLEHCRDTVVGIPGLVAGLSGGERKRTNIGVELITDPKVLLLDEPTSGLDSVTSAKVVHLLQELAHRGRTVIFTIHQPTAEVLTYFDDLLLLTQGRAAYHGPMAGAVDYFAGIGYPCPESFTPTDYFMTLLQDDEVAPKLIAAWDAHAAAHATPYTTAVAAADKRELGQSATYAYLNKYVEKTGSGLDIQFVELSKRAVSEVMRNKMYIFMTFVQAVFFALIVGLIFLNLGKDVQSVQDRQGLLFMITANRAFGSAMMLINTFPRDRAIFVREQRAGAYSPFLYFITKSVAELPVQVLGAFVESVMIYFMTDLHRDAGAFFYYFAVIVMLSQVAGGLGFAISATVESYVVAAGLAPLCVVPSLMTGGLLANTDRLRPYWYWLEKVSFVRQAFVLLARNEFSRLDHISCDAVKYGATFCGAQAQNGNQVIENLGFNDQDQEWAMWVSLAILFVLFRICVVLSLTRVARSTN